MLSARELPAKQSQPGGGAVGRAARVAPGREKRIAAVCWRAAAEPVGAELQATIVGGSEALRQVPELPLWAGA